MIPANILTIQNVDTAIESLQRRQAVPHDQPDAAVLYDAAVDAGVTSLLPWQEWRLTTVAAPVESLPDNTKRWLVWSVWCWMGHWVNAFPRLRHVENWLRDPDFVDSDNSILQGVRVQWPQRPDYLTMAVASQNLPTVITDLAAIAYEDAETHALVTSRLQFLYRLHHLLPENIPDVGIQYQGTVDEPDASEPDEDPVTTDGPDGPLGTAPRLYFCFSETPEAEGFVIITDANLWDAENIMDDSGMEADYVPEGFSMSMEATYTFDGMTQPVARARLLAAGLIENPYIAENLGPDAGNPDEAPIAPPRAWFDDL